MGQITVEMLTTVAGLALVTGMIVFVIRKAAALSGAAMDRFGALLSVAVAIVLAIVAGVVTGSTAGIDVVQGVLNGLVAGLAASGGYDVLSGGRKALIDRSIVETPR